MEFSIDITLWLILCGVALLAGFIDAIVGGGGMLTVPTLLTSGLPPHLVLGTNKLAASFGSFTASFTFYRKKLFDPVFWKLSIIATALGAIIGTLIVNVLSISFLEKALPILVLLTAVYTLCAKSVVNDEVSLPEKNTKLKVKQILQGLTLGFYDGFAGPGTGAFWMASSSAIYKINILLSSGLARSTNFISNFFSLLTFAYLGHIDLLLGLSMGLFMMLGAWIGARSAIKHGGKFIRPIFIITVIVMSINLAYRAWL